MPLKAESFAPLASLINLPITLRARSIDVNTVRRVCVCLGPYRNLTTLTASLCSLNPQAVVLNHAGWRVFSDRGINFLDSPDAKTLHRFIRFAMLASRGGSRGDIGGSIERSHAFDREEMLVAQERSKAQFGMPGPIRCVFWKESLRTSNYLKKRKVDFAALFSALPELVFLMPVRFPPDCAVSNLKTGHSNLFAELGVSPTPEAMVEAIVSEIAWVLTIAADYPDRVKLVYEDEFGPGMFQPLAEFLRIGDAERWAEVAAPAVKLSGRYDHSRESIAHFQDVIASRLAGFPEARDRLEAMI